MGGRAAEWLVEHSGNVVRMCLSPVGDSGGIAAKPAKKKVLKTPSTERASR